MATAFLYEVRDFYCYHVKLVLGRSDSAELVKLFARSFDVWKSNAGQIGQFEADVVKELVRFYDVGNEYFAAFNQYLCLEGKSTQTEFFIEQVKSRLPMLEDLAEKVCRVLCPVAGVDFQNLNWTSGAPGSKALEATTNP